MNDIILTRTTEQNGKQTVGSLVVPETNFTAVTLELPWKSNQNNISCILPSPKATEMYEYEVLKSSPSFDYSHIHIKNVPDRSYIKIHAGNAYTEIKGCVLVGEDFREITGDGILDVVNSRNTLEELLDNVPNKGTIKIINQIGYY